MEKNVFNRIRTRVQVSPSPPKIGKLRKGIADFTYYLFTLNFSILNLADFWK